MSRATGVDLVISGRDESGPILGQFGRRLRELEGTVRNTGEQIGKDFAGRLGRGLIGMFGAQSIDRALREFNDKIRDGASMVDAGLSAAESFAAGLQSFPIAGVIGTWIGEGVDWALGGTLAAERAQQASRKAAEELQKVNQQFEGVVGRLRQDTLTEEQRRRQEFDAQVAPLLRQLEGTGKLAETRDRLNREFEEREGRIRQRAAEEETKRREEEQSRARDLAAREEERRREQEQAQSEREAERAAQEAERRVAQEQRERERLEHEAAEQRERAENDRLERLDRLRQAEERLAGVVSRDSTTDAVLMFRHSRAAAADQAIAAATSGAGGGGRIVELTEDGNEVLEEIEDLQRDQLSALNAIVDRLPDFATQEIG